MHPIAHLRHSDAAQPCFQFLDLGPNSTYASFGYQQSGRWPFPGGDAAGAGERRVDPAARLKEKVAGAREVGVLAR